MSNKNKNPLRLGFFVLASLILVMVSFYLIGAKKNLFSSTMGVQAVFRQAGGLRPGNNVRYMGVNVGTVDRISILNDTAVLVELKIRSADAGNIRASAVASLGNDGLMGNRLVNLVPGIPAASPVTEGTVLTTRVEMDTDELLNSVGRSGRDLEVITGQVRILATKLNTPGNAVDLLVDTLFAQDLAGAMAELRVASEHARGATASLQAMLHDVRSGKGALGALVSDTSAEAQVRQVVANLASISDSIQTASNELGRFSRQLNSPHGLVHALTADTAMADNLRRTLTRLDTGATLLNEDLRALQRNWFFRKYFKEKEKGK
ncbi:MAG: MCE family protein [Flavobacteriales bacterium]|nr:MCE family protein [Flavobacteriales bacterium]